MKQQINSKQRQLPKQRRISESGMTFTLAAIFPVIAAAFVLFAIGESQEIQQEQWFRYVNYLVPQLCMLIAVLIFFKRTKISVKEMYRPCQPRYYLIAIALQFGLLFSVSALNDGFVSFLQSLGYQTSGGQLPDLSGANIIPAILVIALIPALIEETVFRGILAHNLHESGWGLLGTIFISGFLFSIMHTSPEQTIYQFVCGVCFALVTIRARSIFPTMLAHFLNNAVIIILTAVGYGTSWNLSGAWNIVLMVLSAISFAGSMGILIFAERRGNDGKGQKGTKEFWLYASIGIAVCLFEWISAMMTGFANV